MTLGSSWCSRADRVVLIVPMLDADKLRYVDSEFVVSCLPVMSTLVTEIGATCNLLSE